MTRSPIKAILVSSVVEGYAVPFMTFETHQDAFEALVANRHRNWPREIAVITHRDYRRIERDDGRPGRAYRVVTGPVRYDALETV